MTIVFNALYNCCTICIYISLIDHVNTRCMNCHYICTELGDNTQTSRRISSGEEGTCSDCNQWLCSRDDDNNRRNGYEGDDTERMLGYRYYSKQTQKGIKDLLLLKL